MPVSKGENHYRWTNTPTVRAIHIWLNRKYGRANKCENPKHDYPKPIKKFDWALIHGRKYARDRKCFKMLCRHCHIKYDMTQERKDKIRQTLLKRFAKQ